MRNPKFKKAQLKELQLCYVCNRKIHTTNCVKIPHFDSFLYRHDRCDCHSQAWARNKELTLNV